ncbi:MAG: PAS domain S-box protein [Pseudomonadota bacterium]
MATRSPTIGDPAPEAPEFRALVGAALEHGVLAALVSNPDGRVLYCNEACRSLLGPLPEGLDHSSLQELLAGSDGPEQRTVLLRRMGGSLLAMTQTRHVMQGRDGEPVTVHFLQDATELLERMRALQDTAKAMQAIMDNAPVAIAFSREQRISRYNRRFAEIFGFANDEGIGQATLTLYPSREAYDEVSRQAFPLLSRGLPFKTEMTMRRQDDSTFWALAIAYVIDPNNPAQGTIWIIDERSERKAAEESLKQVLLEQRAILDNASIGILFTKARRVQSCNLHAARMFGYQPEEFVGLPGIAIYPSEESYAELGRQAGPLLAAGKSFATEIELKRKDGSLFWCRLHANAVDPRRTDQGTIWIAEDVTERRRADEFLRKTLLEREAIMMNASVGILFVRSGKIVRHNRRLAEMFGYRDDAVAGRSVTMLFRSREEFAATRHSAFSSLAVGKPIQTELPMRRADGTSFWAQIIGYTVNAADTSDGTVWIIEDRSAHRAAEQSLRAALMENEAIVQNAVIGIGFLEQRRVLRCNRRLEEIFGYDPGELVNQSTRLWYFSEEDYAGIGASAYDDLAQGREHVREQLFRRKDGSAFWGRLSGRAIDPAHPTGKSVWLMEDITRRKQSEEEIRQALFEQRLIFDNVTVGIFFVREGRIERCNPRSEEIYGYSPGELAGKPTAALFAGAQEYESFRNRARETFAQGRTFVSEHVNVRKDGRRIWVRVTGRAIDPVDLSRGSIWNMEDITDRRVAENALRETTALQRAILDSASYAIIATGPDGVIRTFNRAAEVMLGYAGEEVIGETRLDLFHDPLELVERARRLAGEKGELLAPGGEVLLMRARAGATDESEWTYVRKDGSRLPVLVTVTALHEGSGDVTGFLAIASDITERKKAQEALLRARDELERRVHERTAELAGTNARLQAEIAERRQIEERVRHMAHHDALTGLPNRTLLKDRMEQAIALAARHRRHVAVMFIDLDRFKTINDTLGHHVGDALLKETARRLRRTLRATDTVARLGGDEFVVVLPELGEPSEAIPLAEKLVAALTPPVRIEGQELHVTPSIGVCLYPRDGADVETLMKNADTAMYQAKANGRNNFQFYAEQMNAQATQHFQLESHLRRAVGTDEFRLYFQPIIDVAAERIHAMEVLLRWQHPVQGLLAPGSFIGIAEETGLIVQLGAWVLRRACEQNKAWMEQGLPVVPLAVNLSPRQFRQKELFGTIHEALTRTGLPPALLEVEITESILMHQGEQTVLTLERLKAMGIALSIDDFGTGYSSLAYLKRFAVQKLKIDRSFVNDLTRNSDDQAIVTAVIALANSLDLVVVAEGVENREQLALLKRLGCRYVQGYYFSRPVPADEAADLLRGDLPSAGAG